MVDFTLQAFRNLLTVLKDEGYFFQPFANFMHDPLPRTVIIRHDVDARKKNALVVAELEKELGISGTYYFRMVPQSFDKDIIQKIASLGHETGYHYEDLSLLDLLYIIAVVKGFAVIQVYETVE